MSSGGPIPGPSSRADDYDDDTGTRAREGPRINTSPAAAAEGATANPKNMDNPAADFGPEVIHMNGHAPKVSFADAAIELPEVVVTPLPDDVAAEKNKEEEEKDDGRLADKLTYSVDRPVYNQPEFDEDFEGGIRQPKTFAVCCSQFRKKCACSQSCFTKNIQKLFPFVKGFKTYDPKKDLLGDCVAGLTVGIMQIPQGMAYAMLAGLEPVYGLYTSFFPVLFYFFFGTSRHVSMGTFAVVSLMVGSAVDQVCSKEPMVPLPTGSAFLNLNESFNGTVPDEYCPLKVATALTFLGGIIQLAIGVLRLGFVTMYLSEPLTRGFTTGASIHVFTSQVKSVFGVPVPRHSGPLKLIYSYRDMFANITQTNPGAVVVSMISMVVLFVVKEFANPPVKKKIKAPIPIDLVLVILATVASAMMDFEGNYDIQIVGDIPKGLPSPVFPDTSYMSDIIGDAFAIAIVAFAISVSMAQLFGKKHNYSVDSNQELIAYGISNIISCNFSCYMTCVSLSRSMVQESVGGKTQLAGLISSLLVMIIILVAADLFRALPNCVLAAIIIVALKGLFMQFLDLKRLWRSSKWDFTVWLVAFLGVVLLDVDLGLGVGIGWSFLITVFRTQRAYNTIHGHVPDTDMYKDIKIYKKTEQIPGIKIFAFEAPVYYANRDYFMTQVFHKTKCNPKHIKRKMEKAEKRMEKATNERDRSIAESEMPEVDITHLIIDCSCMTYLDTMGVGAMKSIIADYKEIGIKVYLAGMKDGVRRMLALGGFHEKVEPEALFTTVHDAVLASLAEQENTPNGLYSRSQLNGGSKNNDRYRYRQSVGDIGFIVQ